MKKLFTFMAIMLTVMSMNAEPVDVVKAKQLAATLTEGEPVLVSKATRTEAKSRVLSAKVQETAPYYIFSRGEGQGFVIVSGDDCLPDILGYTESGDYDETLLPPHFFGWLDYYKTLVEDAQVAGQNVSRKSPSRRTAPRQAKGWEGISPLLTSHWHQTGPYNDRCPFIDGGTTDRALTGCVATAAAQVIYYYRKDNPETYLADTPTYGADEWHHTAVTDQIKKGTPVKWDLMLDKYSGSEPAEFRQAVANLVFAVGAMDYMDYYTSSGAQISDLVAPMSTYFNLSSTCEYKSDGSSSWVPLATWEKKIYDDLAEGHPIIYTGYKDEATGGHAVVLDGYQSNTGLFHFNFGWGGQGDGWYTVDDETGMNHFNLWQGMTYQIRPKKLNVSVSISTPNGFYSNLTNEVKVKVENNSSLNFKGIYLFASTSDTKPTNLGSAKSSDTKTLIPIGETEEISLTVKPTSNKVWYITVTDKNLNVLAKLSVTPEEAASDLHLQELSIDGSSDTETFNDESFQIVYHNKSNAYATIANHSAIGYEGNLRMYFYEYDESTKDWSEVGYKIGKIALQGNAEEKVTFSITNTVNCTFEVGKYYIAQLANPIPLTDDAIDVSSAKNTTLRFILKEGDMEIVDFQDGCLTLKGHFDQTAFNSTSFAAKNAYKTATIYDLTQCTGISTVSQDINPNALIYVADDSKATGLNVVRAGQCAQLFLTPGYNFTPRASFHASQAQITLAAEPAKWYLLTSPFAATVPDGIIAREIQSHSITGIANKTTDVTTLEAGKTYLIMTSSAQNVTLTGENVEVLQAPITNLDEAVVGTYVNTVTPADAQLLNDAESQYFEPVSEGTAVEALRGYWQADDLTTSFRAYSALTTDPAYIVLAQSIETAHAMLEKYRSSVTTEAYTTYLAQIQAAEHAFAHRQDTELTTASKIKNYAAQLLADGEVYKKALANTDDMEMDFTDYIINPSFETKTSKGWTLGKKEGYTSVGGVYVGTNANNYRAVGLDGSYIFQSLIATADSTSVGITQLVEGLPSGYYRLTAMLGTDEQSTVTLFAGTSSVTVEGHPFGHLYLTQAVIDNILVEVPEGAETATLEIGVKEGRWYKADHFTLTRTSPLPDDAPDAIISISGASSVPKNVKGIYTMQGVKLSEITQPGIYIVDGKKVKK